MNSTLVKRKLPKKVTKFPNLELYSIEHWIMHAFKSKPCDGPERKLIYRYKPRDKSRKRRRKPYRTTMIARVADYLSESELKANEERLIKLLLKLAIEAERKKQGVSLGR